MDRIKRLSYEVLDVHKSKFGEDFADNKKALDQIAIIRSKGLKNEIAGYITKFIKKETREEKIKQSQIESAHLENSTIKERISIGEDDSEIPEGIAAISDSETSDITKG
jgi:small subunit ribosomal protein S17e